MLPHKCGIFIFAWSACNIHVLQILNTINSINFFFRLLIDFVGRNDPNTWKGILLAFGMLLTNFTYTILINNFLYYGVLAGLRARSMVNAAVYRKVSR